jgi:transposase
MDETALETRLYPRARALAGTAATPEPDFAEVARELTRQHATRRQLWREYRQRHPNGLAYTAFCVHFRRWCQTTGAEATLAQEHVPGEQLFVDYSGDPAYWIDRHPGERQAAQLFVAA